MRYIIFTTLLFLNTTLSASDVNLEKLNKPSNVSYMGSHLIPQEVKAIILNDPDLSPEDIMCFGFTNKLNLRVVRDYLPAISTLFKLRHRIKTIFSESGYFDDAEGIHDEIARESADSFLSAYFPNANAIVSFMQSAINESDTPYGGFLEYIENTFSGDEGGKIAYFEMRHSILENIGKTFLQLSQFNSIFLPPEIENLTNLGLLDLSNIQLTELPDTIGNLISLDYLNLSHNRLIGVPATIRDLTNLRSLHLSHNQLIEVPDTIWDVTNLVTLDLNNNQLTGVPDRIGNLTNLAVLHLSHNQLIELPDVIGNLLKLNSFYLSNNQMTEIPATIGNLLNVYRLTLDNNHLTGVPDTIGDLINLNYLYLNNNQLTKIPTWIAELPRLEELDLSNNQLTKIPAWIEDLTNVTINLDSNPIND